METKNQPKMGEWRKPLETNPTILLNSKNAGMGKTIRDQSIFVPFFFIKNRGMGEKWEKNTIMVGDGLRIQLILG